MLAREQHGVPREAQLAREAARRRKPRTRAEAARENRPAQAAVELSVQRAFAVEGQQQHALGVRGRLEVVEHLVCRDAGTEAVP